MIVAARSDDNADFHNHIIPGVDDGAVDDTESRGAMRGFVAQGITTVIATPHVDASLTLRPRAIAERLQEIDRGWAVLTELCRNEFPSVTLLRGAELMLDTPGPDLSDERLRLGGHAFVLVEYPYMRVPPNSDAVIAHIVNAGITPIIAHPERYHGVRPESRLPAQWKHAGALLQMNAGSISGRYGTTARANAFALLEAGLIDYLCSDFHSRGVPATAATRAQLLELGGAEVDELIAGVNPRRLAAGERPLPVPPMVVSHSMLRRLKRWLG